MAQGKLIDGKYEYFAFISYKEEDAEWAKWLQWKLEHYRLLSGVRNKMRLCPKREHERMKICMLIYTKNSFGGNHHGQ